MWTKKQTAILSLLTILVALPPASSGFILSRGADCPLEIEDTFALSSSFRIKKKSRMTLDRYVPAFLAEQSSQERLTTPPFLQSPPVPYPSLVGIRTIRLII